MFGTSWIFVPKAVNKARARSAEGNSRVVPTLISFNFQGENKHETYKKILEKNLKISKHVDFEAQRLIRSLLRRDPEKRLGHPIQGGTMAIRAHRFFATTDFFEMYLKRVKPPLNPECQSPTDLGNFDNLPLGKHHMYLEDETDGLPKDPKDELFHNFSYVDPDF